MLKFALRTLTEDRLAVFLFHKVPPEPDPLCPGELPLDGFTRALDFIADNYQVIPLSDAVQRLGAGKLKGRLAAITFDDGYPSWSREVALALEARGLPASFFITTGQLDGEAIWNERLAWCVRHFPGHTLPGAELRLPDQALATPENRQRALQRLDFHLKYMPPTLREAQLGWLERQIPAHVPPPVRMTRADVEHLSARGFEIGAHTVSHPILAMCDRARALAEMGDCKDQLEAICRTPVMGFAYPNGKPDIDFSRLHVQWAKEMGYRYALSSHPGVASAHSPMFQVPRFTPWGPSTSQMTTQMIRHTLQPMQPVFEPKV